MKNEKKRVDEKGRAYKGSQRHIQTYVNSYQDELNQEILKELPSLASQNPNINWVSPLEKDNFNEYQDQEFLNSIRLCRLSNKLRNFWPNGGPVWDALACVSDGGVLLLESKGHPEEMKSNCMAKSSNSIRQINKALKETQNHFGVNEGIDWTKNYYQMANRMAHLYFLEKEKIPVWLVNVYFINDRSHKPTSREEWEKSIVEAKKVLGIQSVNITNMADVFLFARNDSYGITNHCNL